MISGCLGWDFYCCSKIKTKSNLRRRGLFHPTPLSRTPSPRKSGRNLEEGTEAGAQKKAALDGLAQFVFLYTLGPAHINHLFIYRPT